MSPTAEKPSHATHQATAAISATADSLPRILHYDDLPPWMRIDPYIKHGYRRPLASFFHCFWSLFHAHNELVNTWSHLLPGLSFAALLVDVDGWVGLGFDGEGKVFGEGKQVEWADGVVMRVYVAGTAGCLFLSALFHGCNAHSHDVARRFLKLDYLGIVLTISTTCISATYFGLHGDVFLQTLYISLTVVCAAIIFWIVLDPHLDGPHAAASRAIVFTTLAFSGFAPITHVAMTQGREGLEKFPLLNISITCLSYAVGMGIYVYRVPERIWADKFDIWGASHQIFHIFVAFGQVVHLLGLRSVMLKRYM